MEGEKAGGRGCCCYCRGQALGVHAAEGASQQSLVAS